MFELGCKIFLSYLLGSLSGSLLLGRLKGTDIRQMGSGNAGATNALRTQGVLFALGVAIFDVGKGILAAAWLAHASWLPFDPSLERLWVVAACGAAAVVGHIYPFWHDFRGGKGAATLIGAYCIVAPKLILPALVVFLICVTTTGYVGLSTILTVIAAFLFSMVLYADVSTPFWFALLMAVLVVVAHRGNVQRMMAGNENRLERAMVWRK
ncbi:MAG: glycerol-3-phosphate 1-O-acyltransferase PlsY [Gammaproteobacteria bacterium]